jgi:hypothetical protein
MERGEYIERDAERATGESRVRREGRGHKASPENVEEARERRFSWRREAARRKEGYEEQEIRVVNRGPGGGGGAPAD